MWSGAFAFGGGRESTHRRPLGRRLVGSMSEEDGKPKGAHAPYSNVEKKAPKNIASVDETGIAMLLTNGARR